MKVTALARLSGRPGNRAVGDEFIVDKEYGTWLIGRGLAREVPEPAAELPAPVADPVPVAKPARVRVKKA